MSTALSAKQCQDFIRVFFVSFHDGLVGEVPTLDGLVRSSRVQEGLVVVEYYVVDRSSMSFKHRPLLPGGEVEGLHIIQSRSVQYGIFLVDNQLVDTGAHPDIFKLELL